MKIFENVYFISNLHLINHEKGLIAPKKSINQFRLKNRFKSIEINLNHVLNLNRFIDFFGNN